MTALKDFERLESTGIWQSRPDAQRRDVIITVGDATLTLCDQKYTALTHWSLPAIRRVNPGERPALFKPGKDSPERLELTDDTMVDAISRIQLAIEKRKPRPGRLRALITFGAVGLVLALLIFWLPGAMLNYTASVVPGSKRTAIGERLLSNIQRVTGTPCSNTLGRQSLLQLHQRLFANAPGKIVVVPQGVQETVLLPGQIFVINRALVEDHEEPDVAAGYILAESLRGTATDPLLNLLDSTGLFAAFKLLTTGDVPDTALDKYAESLLTRKYDPVPDADLLAVFSIAKIRATPYAYAVDISGETTLSLIEADPISPAQAMEILPDGAWVSLQGICDL